MKTPIRARAPLALVVLLAILLPAAPSRAQRPLELKGAVFADYARPPAFEVNVLWPFYPGGLIDLKVLVPVLRRDRMSWRGELVLGLHSDFGWRFVRDDNAGKVSILGVKLGYRQFLVYGLHLELSVDASWREERNNPYDGTTLDAFVARLWPMAGYQHEFSRRVYANLRAGVGVNLGRTDRFAAHERLAAFGADLNLGLRF
jgi:hypothetical protein